MGKYTISMAIFNSYVSHYQRVSWNVLHFLSNAQWWNSPTSLFLALKKQGSWHPTKAATHTIRNELVGGWWMLMDVDVFHTWNVCEMYVKRSLIPSFDTCLQSFHWFGWMATLEHSMISTPTQGCQVHSWFHSTNSGDAFVALVYLWTWCFKSNPNRVGFVSSLDFSQLLTPGYRRLKLA